MDFDWLGVIKEQTEIKLLRTRWHRLPHPIRAWLQRSRRGRCEHGRTRQCWLPHPPRTWLQRRDHRCEHGQKQRRRLPLAPKSTGRTSCLSMWSSGGAGGDKKVGPVTERLNRANPPVVEGPPAARLVWQKVRSTPDFTKPRRCHVNLAQKDPETAEFGEVRHGSLPSRQDHADRPPRGPGRSSRVCIIQDIPAWQQPGKVSGVLTCPCSPPSTAFHYFFFASAFSVAAHQAPAGLSWL